VTRSSRLLAAGIAVLALALVVLLVSMRDQPDQVTVADAESDVAAQTDDGATGDVEQDPTATEATPRLPQPLEVPAGREAVAVSATYDAGVAALTTAGDRVNVYGVFPDRLPGDLAEEGSDPAAGVVRSLAGVEVLGVTGARPEAGGGSITLVLSLEPDDAARAVYLAGTKQVWFSLVAEGDEPSTGDAVTADNVVAD
jgi:Flp pilus assembly protein CpaB